MRGLLDPAEAYRLRASYGLRAINGYEHYEVSLGGVPVHFMHKPATSRPIPLILTHGWPWTFWHWSKVIDPLADLPRSALSRPRFEQHGFVRGRQVGKHAWIVSRSIEPA